jgi:hypothetical protein
VAKVIVDYSEVTTLAMVFKGTNKSKATDDVNTMPNLAMEVNCSPPMTRFLTPINTYKEKEAKDKEAVKK